MHIHAIVLKELNTSSGDSGIGGGWTYWRSKIVSKSSGTVVFVHHAGKVTGRDGMGGSVDGWTGDADGTVRGESLKTPSLKPVEVMLEVRLTCLGLATQDLERISLLLQDCVIPRKAQCHVYLHLIPR